MKSYKRYFVLTAALMLGAIPVSADELGELFADPDTRWGVAAIEKAHWQFGVGVAKALLLDPQSITQTTTNDLAPYGVPDEFVVVQISGEHEDSLDVQAFMFRLISESLSLGVEADFHIRHRIGARIRTPALAGPDYVTSNDQIVTVTPTVRLGTKWLGKTRLYVSAGAGWASVDRDNTAHYTFGSAGELTFSQDSRRDYLTAAVGAGLEYGVVKDGSIAVNVRYKSIFSSDPLRFVIPGLQFSYHF